MAEAPKSPDTHSTKPHTIKAHKGGGGNGWKWLAGAGVAALVVGIGYAAFNNNGSDRASTEIAYNDSASDLEANRYAGPLASDEPVADSASSNEAPASNAAPASTTERRSTTNRNSNNTRTRTAAAEPVVIEQTIGVGSDGQVQAANYADQETVVVEGRRVLRPQWTRTPSEYRINAAYPTRALERGREGEARVACTVLDTGRLDCAQVSQTSTGFGSAAVRVAESFRHAETRSDGQLAAGTPVNFRVVFRIDDTRRQG